MANKIGATLYHGSKKSGVRVSFSIPNELGKILASEELSNDQKINLVKSYTDQIKGENGKELTQIPNQQAVILIMALEVGAL